ncbi:hypothetical protein JDF658_26130, partial [Carboxydocella sp. JDF658]
IIQLFSKDNGISLFLNPKKGRTNPTSPKMTS